MFHVVSEMISTFTTNSTFLMAVSNFAARSAICSWSFWSLVRSFQAIVSDELSLATVRIKDRFYASSLHCLRLGDQISSGAAGVAACENPM